MGWIFDPEEEATFEDGAPRPLMDAVANVILGVADTFSNKSFRHPELGQLAYADYLETSHWLATRQRARLRAGGICQGCHATGRRLDVHHLTYVRLGCEAESDLIVLCRSCHAAEHGKVPA